MEFKFPINEIFKESMVEIGPNLIPPGFSGDRRQYWDTVTKVSEVVNAMGEASANAQGLSKPITTAERLRNSEHTVYLLIDQKGGNGRGAITGLLKTGKKGLYVFDRNGQHFQVSPPCVLDFYVHESRQRTGLGKRLFEHMLQREQIHPVKMAIDRPSDKFLGFLNKHYGLNNPVKQMNNYVVYDDFFPNTLEKNATNTPVEVSPSVAGTLGKKLSANGLQQSNVLSPMGRYGAPRPHCSMGQIIHNQTSTIIAKPTEPTGDAQHIVDEIVVSSSPKLERPQSLSIQPSDELQQIEDNKNFHDEINIVDNVESKVRNDDDDQVPPSLHQTDDDDVLIEDVVDKLSISKQESHAKSPGKRTPSHLTEQGFFDLKFYHNKLW